jgi:hypothetical protein
MTDELSDLFAEGTAPESDPAFAARVTARIGRERLRTRLGAIALRVLAVLMLAGVAYAAAGMVRPMLGPLLEGSSQFMGVPVPLVLGVALAGLALSAGRYVLSLRGDGFSPATAD